jgi:hypothetical protein
MSGYLAAKQAWLAGARPRAQDWAQRTGWAPQA